MPTYDFSDGLIPAEFKNGVNRGWEIEADNTNPSGDTNVMRSTANPANSTLSSIFILGDFEAGDVNFDYFISSEGSFDFGDVTINGTNVLLTSGTPGTWSASGNIPIAAGIGYIFFQYRKDPSAPQGDDLFKISHLVTPNFTDIQTYVEDFPSGVPVTGWTNDPTYPWAEPTTLQIYPFSAVASQLSQPNSTTSVLEYNSPSDAPAGRMFFIGSADSELDYDFFKVYINNVEQYSDSGADQYRGTEGLFFSVPAGPVEYRFEYSKDSSAFQGFDNAVVWLFHEPSMLPPPPAGGIIPLIMHHRNMQE